MGILGKSANGTTATSSHVGSRLDHRDSRLLIGCRLFSRCGSHAELLSDSPEYANDITAGNLIQWLTGQAQLRSNLSIIAIIGTLLIIFCITFTIIG